MSNFLILVGLIFLVMGAVVRLSEESTIEPQHGSSGTIIIKYSEITPGTTFSVETFGGGGGADEGRGGGKAP